MSRRSKISGFAICLLAVGLMATSAHADVTYTFSGINNGAGEDGQTVGFQFTSSNFITSLTSLLQSQLTSCTHCQSSSSADVFMQANVPGFGDGMQFNDSKGNSSFFLFSNGTFGAPGTFSTTGFYGTGTGTLNVAVPEPGSVALTLAGGLMLALFVFFRQKPVDASHLA